MWPLIRKTAEGQIWSQTDKDEGCWERKCKRRFLHNFLREKWIDLHQSNNKMFLGPFYTFRQYKRVYFAIFVCFLKMFLWIAWHTDTSLLQISHCTIAKIYVIEIFLLEGAEIFDRSFLEVYSTSAKKRTWLEFAPFCRRRFNRNTAIFREHIIFLVCTIKAATN